MKRIGFTLIELLAVIVILAIIVLIATPMILNVVEKARIGAVKESGHGYIEAVEKYQLEQQLDSSMYQIPKNTVVNINKCETTCLRDLVEVKGEKSSGNNDYIKLDTKGKIEEGKLTFQGYEVTIKNGNVEDVTKGEGVQEEKPSEIISETKLASGASARMLIDNNGNLWYYDYDLKQMVKIEEVIKFKSISSGKGFDNGDEIWAIDADYSFWVNPSYGSSHIELEKLPDIIDKKTIEIAVIGENKTTRMMIDTVGNLWGFGNNEYGQLGDGTTNDSGIPIQIKDGTKFVSVTASIGEHILAVDIDGNLWAWGRNEHGQLGDKTTDNKLIPTQVKTGLKFKSVSAGYEHTVAIDNNGDLWAWGNNEYGQLGDGTTVNSLIPIHVKSGTKFKSVSAGYDYTVAIDEEGNLWGWGTDEYGQIGDGDRVEVTEEKLIPTKIKVGTKFKSVSTGSFLMAIDVDENIWVWDNVSIWDEESTILKFHL